MFGYALGRRRDEKPGEAEDGAPAEPDPPRPLALTPSTSPGPNLASPARAKPRERRVFGALDANAEIGRFPTPDAKTPRDAARRENGWTLTDFQAFAELKIGKPGGPAVRWSVEGELFEYPTGRLLARVAGVEVCRRVDDDSRSAAMEREDRPPSSLVRPDAKTISISRKLLLFLDPETNEVMTEFEGRAVEPAAFPYRVVEYAFSSDETRAGNPDGSNGPGARGGSVTATVTVGAGASKMSLTGASVAVSRGRRFANDRVFPSPRSWTSRRGTAAATRRTSRTTISKPARGDPPSPPRGVPSSKREEERGDPKTWTFAWTRFGACAPFGECVLRALARRVPSHEALREAVRRFAKTNAPEYADAPRDLAEIRTLQA